MANEPDSGAAAQQRRRITRTGMLVAAVLGLIGLSMAWSALHQMAADNRDRPQHIVLADAACKELRDAKMPDGSSPPATMFPCSFTGYVFETRVRGLIAVFGVSPNVKGQCMELASETIDVSKSYPDLDYPPMHDLPAQCLKGSLAGAMKNDGTRPSH